MGMLESRVLDFDTVIIASVNEGILPSGKSQNSFIPFDVKLEHQLPTYKEKDAVYTYHFYRLIQRAKNIHIIYNTEPDVLNGGEKSRFITQMDIEGIHHLKEVIVSPKVPRITNEFKRVEKTDAIIAKLKNVAEKGFSPSSLTTYIRNPIDFYYQKVLGIKEKDEVEETVAANTLGTVVHETLKDLYLPRLNVLLTVDDIKAMKAHIDPVIKTHFKAVYKEGDIRRGKNLIIYEIAKRYVENFLNKETEALKQGHKIKVLDVETDVETSIQPEGFDFPIILKGQVDRIDEFDGTLRVIDYKTGRASQNNLNVADWGAITTDYDAYSKSFQVLMYSFILNREQKLPLPAEAGVISFKNLNAGFLKFGKKESPRSRTRDTDVTDNTLDAFYTELVKLLREIFDSNIDFVEKEV